KPRRAQLRSALPSLACPRLAAISRALLKFDARKVRPAEVCFGKIYVTEVRHPEVCPSKGRADDPGAREVCASQADAPKIRGGVCRTAGISQGKEGLFEQAFGHTPNTHASGITEVEY